MNSATTTKVINGKSYHFDRDIKGRDNIGHSQIIPSECRKAASNV